MGLKLLSNETKPINRIPKESMDIKQAQRDEQQGGFEMDEVCDASCLM